MPEDRCTLLATPLERRVAVGASSAQIADEMVAIWGEINAAITPIIGPRGAAALYRRSMQVTGAVHPWILQGNGTAAFTTDLSELKSALSMQSESEAVAGGSALLRTFHGLLARLIGATLTAQLLDTVWQSN